MTKRIHFMHPHFRANPFPIYAEMRRNNPVCQVDPGGMWAVTRYADVQLVLKNPQMFSSAGFRAAMVPPWLEQNPFAESLVVMDPPEHTKLRNLVNRAFGPRGIAWIEPRIQSLASELSARLSTHKEADFVAEFAIPLPSEVIGEILGVDSSLRANFRHWVSDLATITPSIPRPSRIGSVTTTISTMQHYIGEVIEARRREPADDMVTELIQSQIDGQSLTDREIMAFLCLLLAAGLETTVHLLSNSLRILIERPGDFARLKANPSLIPSFIEEVLRYEPPVHCILRQTTSKVAIAGITLPKDAIVLVSLASANRDESQFPDADSFNLDRGSQGGTAFGHGIHFCIGAALARLEARIGLESLLARFTSFERVSSEIEWNPSLLARGAMSLPLRLLAA
jgi:cytochrome P450